jgi:zinc transport system substrate-binding protein
MMFRLLMAVVLTCAASIVQARNLNIVTDIAPVTLLVRGVAGDAQDVAQLISGTVSPHDFALKPSDIRALQNADVIVWLGPEATPGLAKLLVRPEFSTKTITLNGLPGTVLLSPRHAGLFTAPKVTTDAFDPHTWLDPDNGALWAGLIAGRLKSIDPDNAQTYARGSDQLRVDIASAKARTTALFVESQPRPFVQFHDAFQYFENRFALSPLGTATSETNEATSLGTMTQLRAELTGYSATCVFVQDEAQAQHASPLAEIPGAAIAFLDPLGRDIAEQDATYPALVDAVAKAMAGCLYQR